MHWLKKTFLVLLGLLLFLTLVALVGIEAFYRGGLSYTPKPMPVPVTAHYSQRVHETLWYGTMAKGRVRVSAQMPWICLANLLRVFWDVKIGKTGDPQLYLSSFWICNQTGKVELFRILKKSSGKPMGVRNWAWMNISMALWISRHWTTDEVLDTYADHSYFGRGAFGLDRAANVYFKKTPDALTERQLASLIALPWDPQIWKEPKRWGERTDKVEKMIEEGRAQNPQ